MPEEEQPVPPVHVFRVMCSSHGVVWGAQWSEELARGQFTREEAEAFAARLREQRPDQSFDIEAI